MKISLVAFAALLATAPVASALAQAGTLPNITPKEAQKYEPENDKTGKPPADQHAPAGQAAHTTEQPGGGGSK